MGIFFFFSYLIMMFRLFVCLGLLVRIYAEDLDFCNKTSSAMTSCKIMLEQPWTVGEDTVMNGISMECAIDNKNTSKRTACIIVEQNASLTITSSRLNLTSLDTYGIVLIHIRQKGKLILHESEISISEGNGLLTTEGQSQVNINLCQVHSLHGFSVRSRKFPPFLQAYEKQRRKIRSPINRRARIRIPPPRSPPRPIQPPRLQRPIRPVVVSRPQRPFIAYPPPTQPQRPFVPAPPQPPFITASPPPPTKRTFISIRRLQQQPECKIIINRHITTLINITNASTLGISSTVFKSTEEVTRLDNCTVHFTLIHLSNSSTEIINSSFNNEFSSSVNVVLMKALNSTLRMHDTNAIRYYQVVSTSSSNVTFVNVSILYSHKGVSAISSNGMFENTTFKSCVEAIAWSHGSTLTFRKCVFFNNSRKEIHASKSDVVFENTTIALSSASLPILSYGSKLIFRNCALVNNSKGAFYADKSDIIIEQTVVRNNSGYEQGALEVRNGKLEVINSSFISNSAVHSGGGRVRWDEGGGD